MEFKKLRTESDYEEALAILETLMEAEPGSQEEQDLEVLSVLIEKYEEEQFPMDMPDPVSAIKFRMEQQGLKQKDLIPYIGSQSKVSLILRGERELSKAMIRKLNQGLGIPYEVLMQQPGAEYAEQRYRVEDFPFNQMVKRGYFHGFSDVRRAKRVGEELLESLFAIFGDQTPAPTFCRHGEQEIDPLALTAWQAKILNSLTGETLSEYHPEGLDEAFFQDLLRFSTHQEGVRLVKEHLNKKGIHFITLEHLPRTHLDGASFLCPTGAPVIALTLRHDRLDNFWFTLFHELGHVVLHLGIHPEQSYFDDTEGNGDDSGAPLEQEANQFARNTMISKEYWGTLCQERDIQFLSRADIDRISEDLSISPAIVAGRIRYELKDYKKFHDLIGQHQVRRQFTEVQQTV